MKDDEPSKALFELARRLSIRKLLEDFPSLNEERLREILLQASRTIGSAKRSAKRQTQKAAKTDKWIVNVDGASRGNPGPAGAGALLKCGDNEIELKKFLGRATNNIAEYKGLIMALEAALERGAECIEARSDSELMVKQMNGAYKVKAANLAPLFRKAKALATEFKEFKIIHVDRGENADADRLANMAIDAGEAH